MRRDQVALPPRVARVRARQLLADRAARLVGLERPREVALRHPHVAELVPADRQVALPPALPGSEPRQPLADREPVLVGLERPREVALRRPHVADLFQLTDRSRCHPRCPGPRPPASRGSRACLVGLVSAPARSPRARRTSPTFSQLTDRSRCHPRCPGPSRQLLRDRELLLVGLERPREVALRHPHVAELVVGDAYVPLRRQRPMPCPGRRAAGLLGQGELARLLRQPVDEDPGPGVARVELGRLLVGGEGLPGIRKVGERAQVAGRLRGLAVGGGPLLLLAGQDLGEDRLRAAPVAVGELFQGLPDVRRGPGLPALAASASMAASWLRMTWSLSLTCCWSCATSAAFSALAAATARRAAAGRQTCCPTSRPTTITPRQGGRDQATDEQ